MSEIGIQGWYICKISWMGYKLHNQLAVINLIPELNREQNFLLQFCLESSEVERNSALQPTLVNLVYVIVKKVL